MWKRWLCVWGCGTTVRALTRRGLVLERDRHVAVCLRRHRP